jgi:nucleoside-diphosphate-sugar epimerase
LIILRYSTVLGSGVSKKSRMSGPLYSWVEAGLKGNPIEVYQDGNQSRDYVHVDDVVSANILAIESLDEGIYNVGGGKKVKLIDLANWVKKATGNLSEVLIVGGQPSPSDPRHLFSDTKKIKQSGWSTKKTAKKAVYEFVKSFKK